MIVNPNLFCKKCEMWFGSSNKFRTHKCGGSFAKALEVQVAKRLAWQKQRRDKRISRMLWTKLEGGVIKRSLWLEGRK